MSYPSGLQALALDVLGRVQDAGRANARLLALCPDAVADLTRPAALRRWVLWRNVSSAAQPILLDAAWETWNRLPEAAEEIANLRRAWRLAGLSFRS